MRKSIINLIQYEKIALFSIIIFSFLFGGFVLGSHLTFQVLIPETTEEEFTALLLPSYSDDYEINIIPNIIKIDSPITLEKRGILTGTDEFVFGLSGAFLNNLDFPRIYVNNLNGEILDAYELTNKYGGILGDIRLLDNGDILFMLNHEGVFIMNREGQIISEYYDDVSHHAEFIKCECASNGNLIVISAYGDWAKEINSKTWNTVWYWNLKKSLPEYTTETIAGADKFNFKSAYDSYNLSLPLFPNDKSHINSIQYLPATDTFLLSLKNFDLVIEVNRQGKVVWSFGPGIIKQQHTPRFTNFDTLLVFDNGNGRAIEIDKATQQIIWESYPFYSPIMGEINNLKLNEEFGVTKKIVASIEGRIFIQKDNQIIWQVQAMKNDEKIGGIYRAHFGNLETYLN